MENEEGDDFVNNGGNSFSAHITTEDDVTPHSYDPRINSTLALDDTKAAAQHQSQEEPEVLERRSSSSKCKSSTTSPNDSLHDDRSSPLFVSNNKHFQESSSRRQSEVVDGGLLSQRDERKERKNPAATEQPPVEPESLSSCHNHSSCLGEGSAAYCNGFHSNSNTTSVTQMKATGDHPAILSSTTTSFEKKEKNTRSGDAHSGIADNNPSNNNNNPSPIYDALVDQDHHHHHSSNSTRKAASSTNHVLPGPRRRSSHDMSVDAEQQKQTLNRTEPANGENIANSSFQSSKGSVPCFCGQAGPSSPDDCSTPLGLFDIAGCRSEGLIESSKRERSNGLFQADSKRKEGGRKEGGRERRKQRRTKLQIIPCEHRERRGDSSRVAESGSHNIAGCDNQLLSSRLSAAIGSPISDPVLGTVESTTSDLAAGAAGSSGSGERLAYSFDEDELEDSEEESGNDNLGGSEVESTAAESDGVSTAVNSVTDAGSDQYFSSSFPVGAVKATQRPGRLDQRSGSCGGSGSIDDHPILGHVFSSFASPREADHASGVLEDGPGCCCTCSSEHGCCPNCNMHDSTSSSSSSVVAKHPPHRQLTYPLSNPLPTQLLADSYLQGSCWSSEPENSDDAESSCRVPDMHQHRRGRISSRLPPAALSSYFGCNNISSSSSSSSAAFTTDVQIVRSNTEEKMESRPSYRCKGNRRPQTNELITTTTAKAEQPGMTTSTGDQRSHLGNDQPQSRLGCLDSCEASVVLKSLLLDVKSSRNSRVRGDDCNNEDNNGHLATLYDNDSGILSYASLDHSGQTPKRGSNHRRKYSDELQESERLKCLGGLEATSSAKTENADRHDSFYSAGEFDDDLVVVSNTRLDLGNKEEGSRRSSDEGRGDGSDIREDEENKNNDDNRLISKMVDDSKKIKSPAIDVEDNRIPNSRNSKDSTDVTKRKQLLDRISDNNSKGVNPNNFAIVQPVEQARQNTIDDLNEESVRNIQNELTQMFLSASHQYFAPPSSGDLEKTIQQQQTSARHSIPREEHQSRHPRFV